MTFTAADLGAVVTVWTMALGAIAWGWYHFAPRRKPKPSKYEKVGALRKDWKPGRQ